MNSQLKYLWILCFSFLFFNVVGQDLDNLSEKRPVSLSGGMSLNNSFYGVTNISNRRSPYSYVVNANANLKLYDVSIPFSFIYSDEQSNFSQPFNKFGLSPHYKWAKLHLGYRNISFSPFTLAGHSFLGGGVELTPGKLRFGAVYGRFKKAIPEDTTRLVQSRLYQMPLPAYQRMGYALKLGLGGDKNYFDLIFMKAEDDSTSIPYTPEKFAITPGENTVLGLSSKVTFLKRVIWQNEAAVSVYTMDSRAETIEMGEIPMQGTIEKLMTPKVSTQLLSAVESKLFYRYDFFSLQLKYRRIDPDYKSMGAYYFLTDIEQYTMAPSFSLFKNKIYLSGSIGLQRDNLNDKKLATTNRTIGSGSLTYNPGSVFGMNIQYSNYGMSQTSGTRQLSDTVKIHQVTRNIGFSPHLNFSNQQRSHHITMYIGSQTLDDENRYTSAYTEMNSFNGRLSYNLRYTKTQLAINPSLSYIKSSYSAGETKSLGLAIGGNKTFADNRVTTNLHLGYNKNYFQGSSNGFTFTFNTSLNWTPFENTNQSLNLSLRWIRNQAENTTLTDSFSEFTGNLAYHYTF